MTIESSPYQLMAEQNLQDLKYRINAALSVDDITIPELSSVESPEDVANAFSQMAQSMKSLMGKITSASSLMTELTDSVINGDYSYQALKHDVERLDTRTTTGGPNFDQAVYNSFENVQVQSAVTVVNPPASVAYMGTLTYPIYGNGGNARGTSAVDWQYSRAAATQVASGLGATISGGVNNTASGNYASVFGGLSNVASATYAIAGGGFSTATATGALAIGNLCDAYGAYGVAIGQQAEASSRAVGIGYLAQATDQNTIAIGSEVYATNDYAGCIGYNWTNNTQDTLVLAYSSGVFVTESGSAEKVACGGGSTGTHVVFNGDTQNTVTLRINGTLYTLLRP